MDIAVAASDADGAVVGVRLYIDGTAVGSASTGSYRFSWETGGVRLGHHVIRAEVEDDAGARSVDQLEVLVRWTDVAPPQLGDGWATSTAAAQGIDPNRVAQMMDQVSGGGYEFMHALLVVRHGKLVLEEYFGDFTRDSLQHLQSTTKSFTSALLGIAIDRGEISGVDASMFEYLPEYAYLRTPEKDRITIEDCLMMAAGLEWNEITVPVEDPGNDNIIAQRVADYVAYWLGKPVVTTPGTQWYYDGGCSVALGAILRNATGVPADAYAKTHLFDPLGISSWVWEGINGGKHVGTAGSLYLHARDMAKFGQLFLQHGRWNGEQLVSARWVDESTRPRLTVAGDVQYGYQWWFVPMDGYASPFTSGYGGQYIIFVPALDAVIVTAADYSDTDGIDAQDDKILGLAERWIVRAMAPE